MEEQVKDKWEEEEVYEPGMEPQQEEEAQEQQQEEPQEPAEEPAVLAKDGKHTIPYSELEKARRELQELRQQNELLKQFAAQNMPKQDQQAPGAAPPEDPVAKLLEMDRDSFKSYVSEKGVDALYELREAIKQKAELDAEAKAKYYTAAALSRMMQESKQRALRGVVTDWAEENKELLQDPLAAELVKAVDRALFQQKGITDLDQLGPARAKKHLEEVAERVRKMLGGQQAQPAAAATQQPAAPSLSRLAGEGGKPKSLADMSGVDLEMAMLNMSQEDIEKLFEE